MAAYDTAGLTADGLPALRDVIRKHGLSARKNLGQNFILDLNLTAKISAVCGCLTGKTVVEVGPGPGGLTRALLSGGARVIAVERDERCGLALEEVAARWPGKLHVEMADALEVNWRDLVEKYAPGATIAKDVLVIANLPYGIATKLLIGWLETEPWPPWYAGMALMFQKEVAERISAQPGSKVYGRLSVISQWCCETRIALSLPAAAFTPPPKVASAVVHFIPRTQRLPACTAAALGSVTRAVFGQRRKMLRSSLKQVTPFPELLLTHAGIAPELRGEDVDVAGFARLAEALYEKSG